MRAKEHRNLEYEIKSLYKYIRAIINRIHWNNRIV